MNESDHLIKEMTSLLSSLPSAELKWMLTLEKYFFRPDSYVSKELKPFSFAVTGAFLKERMFVLTESAKQEIFDEQGNLKKNPSLTGRSNVTCFPLKDPEFFRKQYPEFPGYEFANILFPRLLGITQLPHQDLIIVNNSYPVLLLERISGTPVFRVWQDPHAFSNLDPIPTGLLIISTILLNPEDGKEDNFILSPDGKFLIPIDNDHCFLPSTFEKEGNFWSRAAIPALQTKTLLFCLDEMNKFTPFEVKEHLLSMNFDSLLTEWIGELIKIENRFFNLVNLEKRNQFLKNGTVMGIPFYKQFIHNIYWKAHKMQEILRTTEEVTPLSLLKALEPFAGRCYEGSFRCGKNLHSRFKAATDQLYPTTAIDQSRVSILDTREMIKIINISEEELRNDAMFQKMGPLHSSELLKQLIRERHEKAQKEQELLRELDQQNKEKKWVNLFGDASMETALKNFFTNLN